MEKIIKILIANVLIIFSINCSAQYIQSEKSMSQDSTSLVPMDYLKLVPATSQTTTTSIVGAGVITNKPSCGASNNSILTAPPTSFLCDSGISSTVVMTPTTNGGENYSWTCSNTNGEVANCAATKRVVGTCGSANGGVYSASPTSLCNAGTASAVTLTGTTYNWLCSGNYGSPATCSASYTPPQPPPVCQWTSAWSNNITVGTTYTVLNPAYAAYGTMSDADFGSTGLPGISEAYQFYGLPWAPATTPSGMYWVLSLDSYNGVIHFWKYALVGTPTSSGSFGGSYVASCGWAQGASRTDMTFFSYKVN